VRGRYIYSHLNTAYTGKLVYITGFGLKQAHPCQADPFPFLPARRDFALNTSMKSASFFLGYYRRHIVYESFLMYDSWSSWRLEDNMLREVVTYHRWTLPQLLDRTEDFFLSSASVFKTISVWFPIAAIAWSGCFLQSLAFIKQLILTDFMVADCNIPPPLAAMSAPA